MEYIPPINVSEIYSAENFNFQDSFVDYRVGDARYLRRIEKLDQKTTGITYTASNLQTNITKNLNVLGLVNGIDTATRNNTATADSIAIGANIVCGQNIINSGDIYTNSIYAKRIVVDDSVFQNTVLKNAFIDDVPFDSKTISFISNLSSDVQLQLDTNSKQIGPIGLTGNDGIQGIQGIIGLKGNDGIQGIQGITGLTMTESKVSKESKVFKEIPETLVVPEVRA